MRGAWQTKSGTAQGQFDTWAQALLIQYTDTPTVLVNYSTRELTPLLWATPSTGASYRLTAITTGDAMLRMQLYDRVTNALLYDSGDLPNGDAVTFDWPAQNPKSVLWATSGVGQAFTVSGELVRAD